MLTINNLSDYHLLCLEILNKMNQGEDEFNVPEKNSFNKKDEEEEEDEEEQEKKEKDRHLTEEFFLKKQRKKR